MTNSDQSEREESSVEETRKWVAGSLQRLSETRPWLRDRLGDAVNDVVLLLLQREGPTIWEAFSRKLFGTPESQAAKYLACRAINHVLDRMRERRRVEIKPGSADYDPLVAAEGRRQRRTVGSDQLLGDMVHDVPDRRDSAPLTLDRKFDVEAALEGLDPDSREVTERRFVRGETWDEIAEALQISVGRARARFADAAHALSIRLRSYNEETRSDT